MLRKCLIIVCLAASAEAGEPLVVPATVPPLTAADAQRAEAMAAGFQAAYPNAFPGGAGLLAAPTAPGGRLPRGTWTRAYKTPLATGTSTVTVGPDGGLRLDLAETNASGLAMALTVRAEVTLTGRTLYGVVTHVNCVNLPPKTSTIEGAPFAASLQVVDGKLLVGRIRCDGGESGVELTACFSGTFEPGGPLPAPRPPNLPPAQIVMPPAARTLQSAAGWLGVGATRD